MAILIGAGQLPAHLRLQAQAVVADWRASVLATARHRQLQASTSRQRQPVARPEPRHRSAHARQPSARHRAPSWYLDPPPTPPWKL